MSIHARLSASSAERWMLCPASVSMSSGVPDKGSVYASYGTVLHNVASYCLSNRIDPSAILHESDDLTPVVEYMKVVKRETKQSDFGFVEVALTALSAIDKDLGGTADYIRLRPSTGELLVIDFKTGSGVNVEAKNNKQLKVYALGALLAVGKGDRVRTVRVAIVQPRLADPDHRYKEWSFDAVELLFFARELQLAADATRAAIPPVVPGEEQCRWCPAGNAGLCPVRVKFKSRRVAASKVTEDDTPQPTAII